MQLETMDDIRTPVQLIEYSSFILSGDGLVDAYDPDYVATPIRTSLLFPKPQRVERSRLTRIVTLSPDQTDLIPLEQLPSDQRARLLNLSIGEAALERYSNGRHVQRVANFRHLAKQAGQEPESFAEGLYSTWNVPMAVVGLRSLVHHREAEPGSEIAVLYAPAALHPEFALSMLQNTIKAT